MSETQFSPEMENQLLLEQALEMLEQLSNILGKQSGESASEAAQRVMDKLQKLKEDLVDLMEIGDDMAYCIEHIRKSSIVKPLGDDDAQAWRAKVENVKATHSTFLT